MANEKTDRLVKHLPLRKVAEDKREADGVFTAEVVDSDNEIADYAFQSKQIKAWADEMFKKTSGAGQQPSLGNVRLQHTSQPVGKVVSYVYDDDAKTVGGNTYIQDANTWQMVKEGILTGFSFGGRYLWRKCDVCSSDLPLSCGENFCPTCQKDVVARYGAKIAELSVVDQPAVPIADILHIKNDGSQTLHKAGQPMEKEAKTKRVAGEDLPHENFAYVGDESETSTWKLPIKFSTEEKTKRHIRNALARFGSTKGIPEDKKPEVKAKIIAAAHAHGIEVSEDEEKSTEPTLVKSFVKAQQQSMVENITAKATAAGVTFRKGLFELAEFAEALQRIAWLRYAAVCEREMEDDDSEIPEELASHLQALGDTFLAMAEEEIQELQDAAKKAGKVTDMKKVTTTLSKEDMEQLPAVVHDVMIGHLADAAATHETMADEHKAMADHHEEQKSLHKAFHDHFKKAAEEGGEHEEHHEMHAAVHKAHMDHHEAKAEHHLSMHKAHSEHAVKCAKAAEECSTEKNEHVEALKAARAAKPAVKSYKKSTTVTASATELPVEISEQAKAASAQVAKEWFASDEYKEMERDRLRKAANINASSSVSIIPGAGADKNHSVSRDGGFGKSSSVNEAEEFEALGF